MDENKYIKELIELCKIKKCKKCDCLQDEIRRSSNEANDEASREILSKCVVNKTHPCLGCNPCKPAILIGKFLREK
jgi:hypothetical protein